MNQATKEQIKRGFPPPPIPAAAATSAGDVQFGTPNRSAGHRIVLYGPGGIGKTTLACLASGPVAVFDLDDSLGRLAIPGDVRPVSGVQDWAGIVGALRATGWGSIKTIVIDSGTKAEELAVEHTLKHIKNEKGATVASIEGYGYGKGYQHVFETFLPLLAILDGHCREGRDVIMICHDCTANVPNPAGDDWIRYEPRLQNPASGKASIRLRIREWADHVLFYGYDIDVKDGKGRGSGTRTLYPAERPHCMAKSRTCRFPIPVTPEIDVWGAIHVQQQEF